ncbi:MAG TPA: tetratricopeptide repeat protein [Gammaproteobacteria bacterium]|nr:tetratricopeptide repeat protein [Gammaproteobacteria bacterium]
MNLDERLQGLLGQGHDGAPLRVSLALACLGRGDPANAIVHLERALALDPDYSAAWKTYGRALLTDARDEEARAAWERGIAAARAAGDRQSEREMQVFLRRLDPLDRQQKEPT